MDLAEQRLDAAVKADDENADAWYFLGNVYTLKSLDTDSASMRARAQAAYEKSLELDDRHAGASFQLAVALVGLVARKRPGTGQT